ncbi:sugar ABC transporter ATP-binding protein [Lysinibacillus antri]|uniref:Sugar ABC transporter ATP-binding protein n=2 Tax=Lysinibacillus antri TaxID=2498145 RepID=A0A3S0PRK2_9BACI|nr:sugar ABC transporter ATP-binding protein [Lysinibacillus antri]RUL55642.1 sugar ABC transporter ATP-binding protein [Lysinibacillus antri]
MQNITIEFPGVKALNDVDFELQLGKIQALIGANGAGKSTLMKILSGAYSHYSGSIFINGEPVKITDTKTAKKLGIDIVYQEVDTVLVPYLSVAENIMLDHLIFDKKLHFINWKTIRQEAKAVLERLGVQIDVDKKVSDISLADKQMVLIARAIVHERNYLILDEPTAPLSLTETEKLFDIVRDLAKNHNKGIVFISHRLPELYQICEKITIMKDGKVVKESDINEIEQQQVIEFMLGKSYDTAHQKKNTSVGEIIFEAKNLVDSSGLVNDVSFFVRKGEIIGLAGLVGAGKTELSKAIFGVSPLLNGEIILENRSIKNKTPHHAVRNGMGLIPEERRKEGIFVEEPIYKNLTIANISPFVNVLRFIKRKKEKVASREMIKQIGAKTPNELQKVANLSGGNQQKIAIGKWLMTDAKVLIFDEPTKGVDVGAKGEIFHLIEDLAANGKGIIYATNEINEILLITDRIYVMYDGEIVKELETKQTSEEEIMFYATGGVESAK